MENSFHKNNYRDLLAIANEKHRLVSIMETKYSREQWLIAENAAADYAAEYHKEIFGKDMQCLEDL